MSYEYKVIPAPTRGVKAKGVRTPEERFANALQTEMNAQASDGWEYLRTDTLPSEQREGLLSKTTVYQNMLVFRRAKVVARPAMQPPEPPIAAPRPQSDEERAVGKKLVTRSTPPEDKSPDASSDDVAAQ